MKLLSVGKRNQIFASVAATFGAFGLGTVLAWTNTAFISMDSDPDDFFNRHNITEYQRSWIVSIMMLGALSSAPVCGWLMAKCGRKDALLIVSIPFVLGFLLVAYATNLTMLLSGRFILGFCFAGFSLLAPVFIGEIAEPSLRGRLLTLFQLMLVLGNLFVNTVGHMAGWRWTSLVCGFVPLIFLISLVFVQESPVSLLLQGKRAEACESLEFYRGSLRDVEVEFKALERELKYAPGTVRPIIILFAIMAFQQLSGINVIKLFMFNANMEFGEDWKLGHFGTLQVVAGIQTLVTLVVLLLVDKVGRKPLLAVSQATMTGGLLVLGVHTWKVDHDGDGVLGQSHYVAIAGMWTYIAGYSLGIGPLTWVMLGEILPVQRKEVVASLATMFNWVLAFFITKLYITVDGLLAESVAYFAFSAVCGVGFLFVLFVVPEMKGRRLEQAFPQE